MTEPQENPTTEAGLIAEEIKREDIHPCDGSCHRGGICSSRQKELLIKTDPHGEVLEQELFSWGDVV